MMYRNPQIQAESEYYPEQKWAILLIGIRRVGSICNHDGTDKEIRYPSQTFREKLIQQPGRHTQLASQNYLQTQDGKNLPEFTLSITPEFYL